MYVYGTSKCVTNVLRYIPKYTYEIRVYNNTRILLSVTRRKKVKERFSEIRRMRS